MIISGSSPRMVIFPLHFPSLFLAFFSSGADCHTKWKRKWVCQRLVCQKREFAARWSSCEVSRCEVSRFKILFVTIDMKYSYFSNTS